MTTQRIHDFIYEMISEITYDRDYLYACYVRTFSEVLSRIFKNGMFESGGEYEVKGIKSNMVACFQWQLPHRLDHIGLNPVALECEIKNRDGELVRVASGVFELSSGDLIPE